MGLEEDKQGTDTTSIRPVSSLRSRFENLGTSDHGSPSVSLRTPSRLSQHLTGASTFRESLDQPRPTVEALSVGSQEPEYSASASNGAIRPRAARPVSMGPTSPPTTPAVMIQSPQSPPKPMFPLQASFVHDRSPPRPTSTGSSARPLVPPLNISFARPDRKELSPVASKKPKPPPPVNRASKPALTTTTLVSLSPQPSHVGQESISPFNTPPESPTSPDSPLSNYQAVRPPISSQGQAHRQILAPPPLHPSPVGLQRSRDSSDDPGQRPNLPARNVQREHASTVSSPSERHPPQRWANERHHAPFVQSQTARRKSPEPPRLQQSQSVRTPNRSHPPPRPSEASKESRRVSTSQTFLPPPKRLMSANGTSAYSASSRASSQAHSEMSAPPSERGPESLSQQQIRRFGVDDAESVNSGDQDLNTLSSEYPDATQVNRRPPKTKYGVDLLWTHYDTRLFDVYGDRICSSGYITKAWNLENGRSVMNELSIEEKAYKISAMAFRPGAHPDDEGQVVWLGSNQGEIQELDFRYGKVVDSRTVHGRHEVIKMHRFQNTIWSIDTDGRLLVWLPDESTGVPNLSMTPNSHRVAKGHTYSIIARDQLWLATGKEIRVYDPSNGNEQHFQITKQALSQPGTGEITSGAVLPSQFQRVYFGHSDGKVCIYSTDDYTCQAVVNVSQFKITSMAGVGHRIWAGFASGSIFVYDVMSNPWKVKKEWKAHEGKAVASIIVNRSSVWKFGYLQVASIGLDQSIKIWDGMLEDDWAEARMHEHDIEYCEYREIKSVVVSWNAGASTPMDIRHSQEDSNFFREAIQPHDPPDVLVFGFQELVDLEDKGLTAKNFFKGRHKKQNNDPDHMGHAYRAWRDYLTKVIDETMPTNESYTLLQTGSLVGLFSCIFIRSSQRNRISDLEATDIKRGMGGIYGNKGAIIIRFVLDSTSLCFINCHLAAGQKETNARNTDATAILEATPLGVIRSPERRMDCYVGGGDGAMVLDHEICILNGDLNYRIDTMGRDSVVKTIQAGNLDRLLERDQLALAKRRNPGLRLRLFREEKITFAPTYKYDVGTDKYDSSEKKRSPAWCDRVLYRGQGRVKMIDYRRHECRASDHRPVSGTFLMRIKNVIPERRDQIWDKVQDELVDMRLQMTDQINADYLVNVLGLDPREAEQKLRQ